MKSNVLIVEDIGLVALDLADRLASWGYTVVGPFANGEKCLKEIKGKDTKIDLAILDIEIEGNIDGIELAYQLNRVRQVPIIYLTKKEDEHTLEKVLQSGFSSYLCKPFRNNELKAALHQAIKNRDQFTINHLETKNILIDRVFVRNGTGVYHILINNIIYIQSNGETSRLVTAEKKKPITVSGNLGKILTKLSFSKKFVRTSRFYVVNVDKIQRINASEENKIDDRESSKRFLRIESSEELIPLSEKYRGELLKRLKFL
ncbi:MAG: response regulator transcription factor [Cyclobacteriaceae bacterium]